MHFSAASKIPIIFRYGLIGANGCGKSTLLATLANREVPIQKHIDIFHLVREMPASDKTALQCVMEVDEERIRLESLAEELVSSEGDGKPLVQFLILLLFAFFIC